MDQPFDVRRAIEQSSSKSTLQELAKKGIHRVKVLDESMINKLIGEAVERIVSTKTNLLSTDDRAKIIEASRRELDRLMKEHQSTKDQADLMQKDKVANPSNAQYDNGTKSVNDFATKKVAMIINQNNADSSIAANGMKSSEYGVVAFPAPQGAANQTASHVAGINLSIFKNTKNKDAALKFVKYMTDATTQTTLGKPFSSLPVLKTRSE